MKFVKIIWGKKSTQDFTLSSAKQLWFLEKKLVTVFLPIIISVPLVRRSFEMDHYLELIQLQMRIPQQQKEKP